MRDGTTLHVDVYRPLDGETYPVLLLRSPYGKGSGINTSYFSALQAAQHGYIVVVQDVRGRYSSKGEFSPFIQEFDDGYDTVEWAARLEGSDGRVGMCGLSYAGITQWYAATSRPPALSALAPGQTVGNPLNGLLFRGGARELAFVDWAETYIAPDVLFRNHRDEPERLRQRLAELVSSIDERQSGNGGWPPHTASLADDGLVPFVREWIERPIDDGQWEDLIMDCRYEELGVPTFHIGGWYDCFIGDTLRQYRAMREACVEGGRAWKAPRLLVGPWAHGSFVSTVGEFDFGLGSSGQFIDYRDDMTDAQLRWFDAVLKGDEQALGGVPPVQVFVMGEDRWRAYEEWPPPEARDERWYLHTEGSLSRRLPSQGRPAEYTYDPRDPVPTVGGTILLPPIYRPGPRDQRCIEERPDVLVYTSEPLPEDYTVLGPVSATLYAASSAADTDFVARLVDVYPDGRAMVVTDGIIRASARESYPSPGSIRRAKPTLITPGQVYEYCIDLWATGTTFGAGHRLRVEITSSSFPRWEPNPNTGLSFLDSPRVEVARQRIFHDPQYPSGITLTVA